MVVTIHLAEKSHLKPSILDPFNLPIEIMNKKVLNQGVKCNSKGI
jgi:hypothetical protein